jgi:hypothetical protein
MTARDYLAGQDEALRSLSAMAGKPDDRPSLARFIDLGRGARVGVAASFGDQMRTRDSERPRVGIFRARSRAIPSATPKGTKPNDQIDHARCRPRPDPASDVQGVRRPHCRPTDSM